MKGIILAGGSATRLMPLTKTISKQILPIYDKPMIYYPLSTLMLAGIRDILIISTPRDLPHIEDLLGDGSSYGINLFYREQQKPEGIAQSFLIADEFINNQPVTLILGDNIFYGHDVIYDLEKAFNNSNSATIFAYHVKDPARYGVIDFDKNLKVLSVEEKPLNPKSSWAITGLYVYDQNVTSYAKTLKPSARGELEITDLNQIYLDKGNLNARLFGRGVAWLDTGTFDSLLSASLFVKTLEERQGLRIACIEEIAYRKNYIDATQLKHLSNKYKNDYGIYLKNILSEKNLLC